MLEKVNTFFEKLESNCIGWILIAMSLLAFTQVVSRYVTHTSLPWLEESVRFLMFWLCYMGVPLLICRASNITIDILPDQLKKRFHINIFPAIDFVVFLFTLVFLRFTWQFLMTASRYAQKSEVMNLPMVLVYSIFLIGNVLAVFHMIFHLISTFHKRRAEK